MKKSIRVLVFIFSIVFLQGCTVMAINMVKHDTPVTPFEEGRNGSPWWYAAIPITVPLDIAGALACLMSFPVCAPVVYAISQSSNPSKSESDHGNKR